MNKIFFTSGSKKNPVNLYYNLQLFLTSHNNSRNIPSKTNSDINMSNNLIKTKKWNLSEMIDIKKKLNLAVKKKIKFTRNKPSGKKILALSQIHMNTINEGVLNKKFNLNNIIGNNKKLSSFYNTKKILDNNSYNYTNKVNVTKKKINFSNILNNSLKKNKTNKSNSIKKKIIKNKIRKSIPLNINKININIINNNININTIKTEGNLTYKNNIKKLLKRKKNFTLDKIPQFDNLLKKNNNKEKDKLNQNKIIINKINNLSKKRYSKTNITFNNNSIINNNLSKRLNTIISNRDEKNSLTKKIIKNIKKIIIKNRYIINNKSLEHKKIIPINYFQDYKKKNSSMNKKIRKEFINYAIFAKFKNIKDNLKKNKKIKNITLISKPKRPYSREEKANNITLKIKQKSKDKANKNNNILKIVINKTSLPDQILNKKINKGKNVNIAKIIPKSEIKKNRAKSNNKSLKDKSQKISKDNLDKSNDKLNENEHECDIDDILQNKKIPEEKIDNFDNIYSIVKTLNFNNINDKDDIFSINNNNYLNYKKIFEKKWNKLTK